ncbi:Zinc D-Ala-D-Ala carboxypeptidase precursor [Bacillus sp. THAF10]|uniref:D-Ala-D-Ala carboxypeptidase family metallohydrolase n=1 Tax=Bacillus sp. THAF10 TaxID=2587848 RepID=UPI001267B036|nr:D-Ala-D-Ala carboxypeptidase family metallohydrolase [Bacillus sp. THAF10]QFT87978.1 Zinc D-Ala-D-Ala carboxypeptidase precursor [Bacillus sp. THAF10]
MIKMYRGFLVFSFTLMLGMVLSLVSAEEVSAYNWTRTLSEGSSGADVRELQIRVAGWAADSPQQTVVSVDGEFGPGTKAAVIRFQRAYGLSADGVVGPQTQAKLNDLESANGTKHFSYSEFYSKDGSQFNGGNVSAATVKENVRRTMYKLEAVRVKLGNRAININSGFRSISHNRNVGGTSNSQHTYGIAADISVSGVSNNTVQNAAKSSGFSGIYSEGSFTHMDSRVEYAYGAQFWWWD